MRDFRQILPVERNPMDSINTCLKQSFLWEEKIIQPMSLTINERVRQFGGHDSYATFLMYVGLGLLKTRKKKLMYHFKEYTDDFMKLPRKIGGQEIVGDFENREQFIDHLFPTLGETDEIPESVVLTPKNKNMNEINELCLDRYRPDEDFISVKSRDKPYVPEEGK